jgi:predicted nucleotidyltransferase
MIASLTDLALNVVGSEKARIVELVPRSKWYLFGSVTSSKHPVGDIDLLVVCESSADCARVRARLADVCTELPIHLILMTQGEEAEVSFIKGVNALELGDTPYLRVHVTRDF